MCVCVCVGVNLNGNESVQVPVCEQEGSGDRMREGRGIESSVHPNADATSVNQEE